MFGRGVGRVRSGAAIGRQPQYARPERGEHTSIGRHAVFVELVEVRLQRFVRLAYCAWTSGWPTPTPSTKRPG